MRIRKEKKINININQVNDSDRRNYQFEDFYNLIDGRFRYTNNHENWKRKIIGPRVVGHESERGD